MKETSSYQTLGSKSFLLLFFSTGAVLKVCAEVLLVHLCMAVGAFSAFSFLVFLGDHGGSVQLHGLVTRCFRLPRHNLLL